jgi:kumamolisin
VERDPDGSANVSVTAQRAWGWDYLWPAIATITGDSLATAAESAIGGGGGGFSVTEATPSYQLGVSGTQSFHGVDYLQPTDYESVDGVYEPVAWNFSDPPPNVTGSATGRAEPDLSADADPQTGYLLYAPSFAQVDDPLLEGGWGGTSFIGPQMNGSTAVIESSIGRRVGFWNPSIYGFATSDNSPFNPLNRVGTSNDNLFFSGNPGDIYNAATGLGTPNLTALASDFASQR